MFEAKKLRALPGGAGPEGNVPVATKKNIIRKIKHESGNLDTEM